MFCRQCGTQLEAGNVFCANCGAKVRPMEPATMQHAKRRPGLLLIIIYTVFSGLIELKMSVDVLGRAFESGLAAVLGTLILLAGVLDLACGYGLWNFQAWGLTLAKGLYIASIPLSIAILPIIEGSTAGLSSGIIVGTVIEIAVAVLILRYLFKKEIQLLFDQTTS